MSILNYKSIKYFEKIILFIGNILSFFSKNDFLRILVYHDIEKKDFNKLYQQLKYLKTSWNFITPKDFENHITNKKKLKGKNLLISFDDGFKSNYLVSQNILNKLNIKGIFFVPSDFIQFKSKKKASNFAKKNILNNLYDNKKGDFYNISINDLKSMKKKGHEIGCHSKSHANLGLIQNTKKLKIEILQSGNILEKILNTKIKHFAFTYGDYNSMSKKSLDIALTRYDFIYSCLRGNNFYNNFKEIIKRDPVYLNRGNDLLNIFLTGLIDLKYFYKVKSINKIIKKFNK